MSSLVEPPFAHDPPVKLNINAKTLGLVLLILGAIGILFSVLGLLTIFGFCSSVAFYGGCGLPIIWLLGELIRLVGLIIGTIGAYRMYQGNREGKLWVIYGLILGLVGAVVTLIGNLAAYSGLVGIGAGGGVIVGLILDLIIYGIIYYIVVISRYPGDTPYSSTGGVGGVRGTGIPSSGTGSTWSSGTTPTDTGGSTWSGGGPAAPPPPPTAP